LKQLELNLKIKGTPSFDDVPTLKELIERKRNRPKHLENLSDKHYNLLKELHKGRL
jgi:predicted CopG family antitoxin